VSKNVSGRNDRSECDSRFILSPFPVSLTVFWKFVKFTLNCRSFSEQIRTQVNFACLILVWISRIKFSRNQLNKSFGRWIMWMGGLTNIIFPSCTYFMIRKNVSVTWTLRDSLFWKQENSVVGALASCVVNYVPLVWN